MELAKKVKRLRQNVGLSQQEFADYTGFSLSYIQKFEEGKREMKTNHLIRFSKVLKVKPFDIINTEHTNLDYSGSAVPPITLSKIEYREKKPLNNFELFEKSIIDSISDNFYAIIELENILKEKTKFKNPVEDMTISSGNDIEKAVTQIRKKWKLGQAPIYDVVYLLENKGVKIFEVERTSDFVGFSGWAGEIPIIVLNAINPAISRRRFTALHELAHLILRFDIDDSEQIERFCNHFAGAMLLVEDVLLEHFRNDRGNITLEELRMIKLAYGISIQAIMLRAKTLNIINWDTYHTWKQNYEDWRGDEGNDFGKYDDVEHPKRFYYLLSKGLNDKEQKLSAAKASELSGETIKTIKSRFANKNFALC